MSGSQSEVKQSKPFDVSKSEVWMAWEQVLGNKGAAGIDQVELDEFADWLQDNLYRVWNRMASGSYHPAPVRAVAIPKPDGGVRGLGIPTVADRVAQTVAARRLEAAAEPLFSGDSFGFRPGRSAHDAVRTCRDRCWQRHWVVDLDIARFFDSVDWELLMMAVESLDLPAWVALYVRRWLAVDAVAADGNRVGRGLAHRLRLGPFGEAPVRGLVRDAADRRQMPPRASAECWPPCVTRLLSCSSLLRSRPCPRLHPEDCDGPVAFRVVFGR